MKRGALACLGVGVCVALTGLFPGPVAAQAFRGWVGSRIQMVEVRPLAESGGVWAPGPEGRSVSAAQDLSLTGWGLGVRGLSVVALLRTRQRLGSELVWPRADDEFDAILAYAQYVRGRLRTRIGRQEMRSGLGFSSFDGGTVSYVGARIHLEGYGGRSLARGLREPEREALRGIEDFVPDQSVDLFGGSASLRLFGLSLASRYQREVLRDRSGLSSERGALDFSAAMPGMTVTGSLDYDFAFERFGKGHLTASMPFDHARWTVQATVLRYVPYFSLSTIWGFFEPVDYQEASVRAAWSRSDAFGAWLSGGVRRYGDSETAVVLRALSDVGRRASAGARWRAAKSVTLDGSYRLEWGPGGFLNSADIAGRWQWSSGVGVSLSATSFQQIEQFRLGDGRAIGGGVSIDARLADRWSLDGGVSLLQHRSSVGPEGGPWNQGRAWLSLRGEIGRDPGLAAASRRGGRE